MPAVGLLQSSTQMCDNAEKQIFEDVSIHLLCLTVMLLWMLSVCTTFLFTSYTSGISYLFAVLNMPNNRLRFNWLLVQFVITAIKYV
jgi:hypothetical protein